jgi:hypothetical protein
VAVVATLSKGYDLEYIWKQVDRGPAKDAASYYIQASESGGEPPGRWWGPGAKALGFEPGQRIEGNLMTCCSASARPPTAPSSVGARTEAGRLPTSSRSCWLQSRPSLPSANASSVPRPSGKHGQARCSST